MKQNTELEKISAGTVEKKVKIEIPKELISDKGGFKDFEQRIKNSGTISIKPLVIKDRENFGLEKYNMVIFPNSVYTEDLACLEYNDTFRYVTGLDEYAPEVQNMQDEEQKRITIKTIREIVSYLEKILASNNIDPEDEHFWDKVKKLRPDNENFWGKIRVELTNTQRILDPMNDPNDMILLLAIEAGGFSGIAKSYEDAVSMPELPKFYLDKRYATATAKASLKKTRNKAIAMLDNLFSENYDKVFYIAKILDLNSKGFKKSTPKDIIYDFLDEYISGNSYETNKSKAPQDFINLVDVKQEQLMLRAMVKDAILYHVIATKPDGSLYYIKKNAFVGKSNVDAVAYMANPINEDIFQEVYKEINTIWQ